MRRDGVVASMALEGATDQPAFETYVQRLLAPNLRRRDIVVMDNPRGHESPCALAAIEAVGAEAGFLPPYAPDLNPIEQMWSKLKQWLRRATARDFESPVRAIGKGPAAGTPAGCHGFFTAADTDKMIVKCSRRVDNRAGDQSSTRRHG